MQVIVLASYFSAAYCLVLMYLDCIGCIEPDIVECCMPWPTLGKWEPYTQLSQFCAWGTSHLSWYRNGGRFEARGEPDGPTSGSPWPAPCVPGSSAHGHMCAPTRGHRGQVAELFCRCFSFVPVTSGVSVEPARCTLYYRDQFLY